MLFFATTAWDWVSFLLVCLPLSENIKANASQWIYAGWEQTFYRTSMTDLETELSHRHFSPCAVCFLPGWIQRGVNPHPALCKSLVMQFASLLSPEQLNLMKITSFYRIFPVMQVERHIVPSAIRQKFMLPERNVPVCQQMCSILSSPWLPFNCVTLKG